MSDELSPEEYDTAVDNAQEAVKAAISNYLQVAKQSSLLVTKFAVVAETYQTEEDGHIEAKSLVHFVDNMMPWETYGMLNMVSKDVWMDSRDADFMYGHDSDEDEGY